LVISLLNLNVK